MIHGSIQHAPKKQVNSMDREEFVIILRTKRNNLKHEMKSVDDPERLAEMQKRLDSYNVMIEEFGAEPYPYKAKREQNKHSKVCIDCKKDKELSEYYCQKTTYVNTKGVSVTREYYRGACKECVNKQVAKYYRPRV